MKKYSLDTYQFKSPLNREEIKKTLEERTLKRTSLGMERTNLDFIGSIEENSFTLFDSFFPVGIVCVIKGEWQQDSALSLTTSLHKAFRILYLVWVIVILGLIVTFGALQMQWFEILGALLYFAVVAALFRYLLHKVYCFARKRGLNKLKTVLSLSQVQL